MIEARSKSFTKADHLKCRCHLSCQNDALKLWKCFFSQSLDSWNQPMQSCRAVGAHNYYNLYASFINCPLRCRNIPRTDTFHSFCRSWVWFQVSWSFLQALNYVYESNINVLCQWAHISCKAVVVLRDQDDYNRRVYDPDLAKLRVD